MKLSSFRYAVFFCASLTLLRGATLSFTTATPTNHWAVTDPAPAPVNLVLPQFDPSLGTLLKATLYLDTTSSLTLTGTNPLTTNALFTYYSDTFFTIPALTAFTPDYFMIYRPDSESATVAPGAFSVTGPALAGSSSITLMGLTMGGQPQLSPFIGSGTVTLASDLSPYGPDAGGRGPGAMGPLGLVTGPTTNWAAQLRVDYSYTPASTATPEPGAAWMMGLGLIVTFGYRHVLRRARPTPLVG